MRTNWQNNQQGETMNKRIELPCYEISIVIEGKGGFINSNLADGEPADYGDEEYLAGVDAIESMILAHAIAGVDVESPAYIEGIETAVQALTDHTVG